MFPTELSECRSVSTLFPEEPLDSSGYPEIQKKRSRDKTGITLEWGGKAGAGKPEDMALPSRQPQYRPGRANSNIRDVSCERNITAAGDNSSGIKTGFLLPLALNSAKTYRALSVVLSAQRTSLVRHSSASGEQCWWSEQKTGKTPSWGSLLDGYCKTVAKTLYCRGEFDQWFTVTWQDSWSDVKCFGFARQVLTPSYRLNFAARHRASGFVGCV